MVNEAETIQALACPCPGQPPTIHHLYHPICLYGVSDTSRDVTCSIRIRNGDEAETSIRSILPGMSEGLSCGLH
jgi:hypothetical protein